MRRHRPARAALAALIAACIVPQLCADTAAPASHGGSGAAAGQPPASPSPSPKTSDGGGGVGADDGARDRAYTVSVAAKVASPVLEAGATRALKQRFPVHGWEGPKSRSDRSRFTHLEAVARTLSGVAPWLELGADGTVEGRLRGRLAKLAVATVESITDPASPDAVAFDGRHGRQPLVDAAFLAHALLRAPTALWAPLSAAAKARVASALRATRAIAPWRSNWVLFSAVVEAALLALTGEHRAGPVAEAIALLEEWYVGDGAYGDGDRFHHDYYNSFVMHPMLRAVVDACTSAGDPLCVRVAPAVAARGRRYAAVLERFVSPEGTFPAVGRSLVYRTGAMQQLADAALRGELPESVAPAAVRCALTAVTRRTLGANGTFDGGGWLRVGLAGHQPSLRELYISTGSLYLCATGWLHLGLPPNDTLWSAPAAAWTSKRVWAGEDAAADAALPASIGG